MCVGGRFSFSNQNFVLRTQVQEEAARQHGVGGFGKVTPTGGPMPPPVIQRSMGGHMGPMGQQQQQGMPVGMGGPGPSGNLLPMEQWGPRYPNNGPNQQVMRQPNPGQMMQGQQMPQQQVNVGF